MRVGLNDRQMKIIELVNKFRFLSVRNLEWYFGVSYNAINLAIDKMVKAELLRTEKIFYGGDKFVLLDKLGCGVSGSKYIKKINSVQLIHDNLLNTLAIDYYKRGNEIKLEHEFIGDESNFNMANKIENRGVKSNKYPDLVINENLAVELELSVKTKFRVVSKITKLDYDTKINKVHWISNKRSVLKNIATFTKGNPKHEFYLFDSDILVLSQIIFNDIEIANKIENNNKEFII